MMNISKITQEKLLLYIEYTHVPIDSYVLFIKRE